MTFNDIDNADSMIGGNPNDVSLWNTYWDFPTNGNAFTSVEVIGNVVKLKGGSNINMKTGLFDNNLNTCILSVVDESGCIITASDNIFGGSFASTNLDTLILPAVTIVGDNFALTSTSLVNLDMHSLITAGSSAFNGCSAILNFNMPVLVTAGDYCFAYTISVTDINFPSLITAGDYCFAYMYVAVLDSIRLPVATTIGNGCFYANLALTKIYIPSCLFLGSTVLYNSVFDYLGGYLSVFTLTIPTALMHCNSTLPDGDIQDFIMHSENNPFTLTIIEV